MFFAAQPADALELCMEKEDRQSKAKATKLPLMSGPSSGVRPVRTKLRQLRGGSGAVRGSAAVLTVSEHIAIVQRAQGITAG